MEKSSEVYSNFLQGFRMGMPLVVSLKGCGYRRGPHFAITEAIVHNHAVGKMADKTYLPQACS